MRWMLAMAMLAAVAAFTFGALGARATPGHASHVAPADDDRGGVSGALSQRAYAVTPPPAHARVLRLTFARAHADSGARTPRLRHVREATHQGVLWALATFALTDGTLVAERFSRRRGEGWHDLGATRARCPAVPPEVRSVWRLTSCQTA